ncbi:MAG: type I methionyl aminopeptidase [Gemmatimonadetes bacterium]|nr:type I methionyl aminopeptidase [Gemmatimonadota bacterium]|tara:strand:- start:133 stop:900 length:768 start_codon:yes stop_codon:yes gene_type:complete
MIALRTTREFDLIRESCKVVGAAHQALRDLVRPGVSTGELDGLAEQAVRSAGAEPAFKGYHGYPATACISVNEVVVHGIPGERTLESGDVVSIDIGAKLKGYFGDQAITFPVGEIEEPVSCLLEVTRQSLFDGIDGARAGGRLADISGAVQSCVEENGFSVVRQFVGHGIGRKLHEDPPVPNYVPVDRNPRLRAGMVLAIEPMVNLGRPEVCVADDGWTASAVDGKPSAHFEHVVAVTDGDPEILTMTEDELGFL